MNKWKTISELEDRLARLKCTLECANSGDIDVNIRDFERMEKKIEWYEQILKALNPDAIAGENEPCEYCHLEWSARDPNTGRFRVVGSLFCGSCGRSLDE